MALAQQGIHTHMADLSAKQAARHTGIYPEAKFTYDAGSNTYRCPAGEVLRARRLHPSRRTWEYATARGVCAQCALRSECTRSLTAGRTLHRHEHEELLRVARAQAHSRAARRDRRRRMHLMEKSFADAANRHGFKRSRYRRLWRQRIQDWLIAVAQNLRILIKASNRNPASSAAQSAKVLAFPPIIRAIKRLMAWFSALPDLTGSRCCTIGSIILFCAI